MTQHDNPPFIPCDNEEEWAERMHNAVSFIEIPDEQLSGNVWTRRAIKLALEIRALSGYDCYAYSPAHQPEWVIWDRQEDPAIEARFSPRQWAINHGYAVDAPTAGGAA